VLLAINLPAVPILSALNAPLLTRANVPIRRRIRNASIGTRLTHFQPTGFAIRQ
jgi:hypothetical protein